MKHHCPQCKRLRDLAYVAGSKESGFCQHCGLRIEIEPTPTDPSRREFVKNAVAGAVLGKILDIGWESIHQKLGAALPGKSPAPEALKISVSDSAKVRERLHLTPGSPYHGVFIYEAIGPNAPRGQYHGQVS